MRVSGDLSPEMAVLDIDLSALSHNTRTLRERVKRPLMAVVKADGYGHGIVESARGALAGGADALGVTTLNEAKALRDGGIAGRVVSWLHSPGSDFAWAVGANIELGISSIDVLNEIAASAPGAVVHLKIDTGLGRAGCPADHWPAFVDRAAELQRSGSVHVVGVWSHFAFADAPGHPTVKAQVGNLHAAAEIARNAGLRVDEHIANSAATLTDPDAWCDLVRPGVSIYGLDPMGGDPAAYGLRPAMRARAAVMLVKEVPAGTGVSYGLTYTTSKATRLAVVPVGYADGIPRAASNRAPVVINGQRFTISGRVCMDQFVVDVGDADVNAGDDAVLWGDAAFGEPSAQEWADAAQTIHYEIVARAGGRFVRRHHENLRGL